jgi:serine protease
MRPAHSFLIFLLLFLMIPTLSLAIVPTSQVVYVKISPDNVELDQMVEFELAALPAVLTVEAAVPQAVIQKNPDFGLWQRLVIGADEDVDAVLEAIRSTPGVAVAERAPVREITVLPGSGDEVADLPNDPLASFQWHLATVNAFAAWDVAPYASEVKIAILDNGVDIDHPDLQSILWKNTAEIGGQGGYDDDGNGFIDDTYGWDAYEQDGNPDAPPDVDSPGHGTHCSGIAAAVNNNGIGGSGLGRGAKIMAVRIGNGRAIYNAVEGLIYAAANQADVISMSFAGPVESVFERDIIDYAVSQGAVIVAAAGNEGSNQLTYPAAYPNVIAVAATDLDNDIASFSNRGWWVQAAAPGVDIFSTFLGGYGYSSGTSMATPMVAGLVALLKASDPTMHHAEVLARIQQGARPISNANSLDTPAGVIDAWRSVLPDRPVVAYNGMFVDDDDDNRLSGGETANVVFNMELLGSNADNVSIKLFPVADFNAEFEVNGQYNQATQSIGEFTATFEINVYDNFPDQGDHPSVLIIDADGWMDTLSVRLPIDPPYMTVRGGDLIASVTDFGAIGFKDYMTNDTRADGVRLDGDILGQLYHGSVMVGNMVNVADNAYGPDNQSEYDFDVQLGQHFSQLPSSPGTEIWQSRFSDQYTSHPVDVSVRQTVTTYEDGGNIIYLDYSVERRVGAPVDMNVGVYCDWDILNLMTNTVRYDSGLRLSYMRGEGYGGLVRYAGVVALGDRTISGVRAINNAAVLNGGFSDTDKNEILMGGTSQASSTQQTDWSHMIAVEVPNVGSGSVKTASFAIVVAGNEQDLLNFAAEALAVHDAPDGPPAAQNLGIPSEFELTSAWPNPFNASTRVSLTLDANADVNVAIYDVLGRNVATLHKGRLTAGSHDFSWNGVSSNGQPVATGVYIVEARAGEMHSRQKVVLMK